MESEVIMKKVRIAEYLEIVDEGGQASIRCTECGKAICSSGENYKLKLPFHDRNPKEIGHDTVRTDWIVYREYFCPECATLLIVVPMKPMDEEFQDTMIF
jgi:acetone carboxylase gamma subunit